MYGFLSRIDGQLPGADKTSLVRALHNIPPKMSIEESLGAIPITLLLILFVFIPLFKLLEALAEA